MKMIETMERGTLPEAPATPGIKRFLAFEGDGCVVVRSNTDPGSVSAWHHHGEYDVYGYIIAGAERFEFGPGGGEAVLVQAGDFFHIPPGLIHRDVNPSPDEDQEVVLFFRGEGPLVVNVNGPDQA